MRTTDPGPEPALPRPAAPAQTTDSGPGPALPRPAAPAPAADGARRLVAGLSVVLPCSGAQAAGVDEAIRATAAAAARSSLHYEIVVVDDGGGDETARAAARFVDGARPVRLLVHPHPRGYGAAVRTGLDAARMPWVLLGSPEEELTATDLGDFAALSRTADVVAGRRTHRSDPPVARLLDAAWNRLLRVLFDLPVHDVACPFKLIRRDLLEGLELRSNGALIAAELLVRCRAEGARIAEHPIRHRPRASAARRRVRAGAAVAGLAELARRQGELRRVSRTVGA
jgi:glycosyltransferase involved in cell wall biosynthesis